MKIESDGLLILRSRIKGGPRGASLGGGGEGWEMEGGGDRKGDQSRHFRTNRTRTGQKTDGTHETFENRSKETRMRSGIVEDVLKRTSILHPILGCSLALGCASIEGLAIE